MVSLVFSLKPSSKQILRPIVNTYMYIVRLSIVLFVQNFVQFAFGMTWQSPQTIPVSDLNIMENFLMDKLKYMQLKDEHDLVFLLDSSGSVGEENFRFEVKFVRKVLHWFKVSVNHTRIAIVRFSNSVRMVRPNEKHIIQTIKKNA